MGCEKCKNIVDRKDVPHVIRKCKHCGRVMHVYESNKNGRGLKIREGDKLVFPKGWFTLSFDPRKTRAKFTRYGLNWLAKQIFLKGLPKDKSKIRDT